MKPSDLRGLSGHFAANQKVYCNDGWENPTMYVRPRGNCGIGEGRLLKRPCYMRE
jgi:hypothetical protein